MQTNGNPTTFKLVNPGGNTPVTNAQTFTRSPGVFPGDMPNAIYTQEGLNLHNAIAAATTPKAKAVLDSTTAWSMPDVSGLPPQATPSLSVPHDWLSGLTAWLQHLLPTLSLSHLPVLLSTWLGGLGPWLIGALGLFAVNTVLHKLTGGFAPKTRAAAEYADYGALDDSALKRAQAHGVTGVIVDAEGNVHIPRYHLGSARRAGLKGH